MLGAHIIQYLRFPSLLYPAFITSEYFGGGGRASLAPPSVAENVLERTVELISSYFGGKSPSFCKCQIKIFIIKFEILLVDDGYLLSLLFAHH